MQENSEVIEWFLKLEQPQNETMQAIWRAILGADARISECIKWSSPTFVHKGDLASLQPNAKKFASLMFHKSAQIPGVHPFLEGDSRLVRTMKFTDVNDVLIKHNSLPVMRV